jgi:pilus assembly protein Flp/PilA
MTKFFNRFAKDESGATAIEYGLIAGAMAVVLILALPLLKTNVAALFTIINNALTTAAS